jgi:hypothetical protein
MTCQELRLYFEDPLRSDAEFCVESEHLVYCAECARFVDMQRQLGAGLRRLREAVPQFPGRLDASVLAHYRRNVMNGPSQPNAATARRRLAILCMTGAAAAMVLVTVVVFFLRPRAASPISGPRRPESAATSQPIARSTSASFSGPAKIRSSPPGRGRHSTLPVATPDISLSPGFRSLMYCDELSCGGVMELIRVQLPSSGIGLEPASAPASGTIIADVLVGPDGIARGIRIVE